MNKLFTKIAALFLGSTMAVGVGVAVSNNKETIPVHATAGTVTLSSGEYSGSGTSGIITWSTTHLVVVQSRVSGTNVNSSYISAPRWYQGNKATFTPKSGYSINSVTVTATSSSYADALNNSTTWSNVASHTKSGSAVTITPTTKTAEFYVQLGAQSRISTITYDYTAGGTTYTITYDANGGSGTMTSTTGADPEVAACTFTAPSGKEFGYWHTTSSGTGGTTYAAGDHPKKNADLYAIWVNQKALTSIDVTTPPTTTIYSEGQSFDPTGMVVTATFDDASTSNVTNSCTFTPSGALSTSDTSITVSYAHNAVTKTTTQAITVKEVEKFEKITTLDDLVTGSKYLIGKTDGSVFMSSTQNTNNRGAHTLTGTITDNKVGYENGMEVLELGGSTGEWTLYATKSDTKGYLYAASSSSNHLRTQATNDANGQWAIALSSGNFKLTAQGSNSHNGMQYNANSSIFSCYTSASDVSLWKLVDTTESVAISKDSVSDMKGNINKEVQITANNFTPTGISSTYSVANIASVTAGTIKNGIIPLNISCAAVGSTVATISVSGGNESHSIDLSITVAQKPASLTLVNEYIKQGEIEVKHGGSRQISFTALDTDGENYPINYSGITASSSNANVKLTGNVNMVLNGDNLGDAVVTCTITATAGWQTPITQTLTVHVIDDHNEKNVNISVINNVNVDQGEVLVIDSHISSATATTHFGTNNNPIEDDELLFSYTNNRSAGVVASSFVWDVTDPDLGEGDTETRTVYVFVTFNESYAGTSFTAIVTVQSRQVVGLKVDGVSKNNNDDINLELPRNSTYNFNEHVTVDPVNATESHVINYVVEDGSEYVSVAAGVMTIGSKTGSTVACVSASPAALSSFKVYFWISITREAMTITADVPESWTKASSLSVGDTVVILNETASKELTGVSSNIGTATEYSTNPSGDFVLTVGSGSENGSFTFSNGSDYLAYTKPAGTSKNNNLFTISNPSGDTQLQQVSWTVEFSDGNATITNVYNSERSLQFNSDRFCCYASSQTAPQIYKLSGGETEVTVTDELFNVVNGAMSLKSDSQTLYDLSLCNASGTSFDTSAWNTLGSSFTDSIISDNKLAYARADQNGNEIEQFLAVYDYVIGKKVAGNPLYSGANDFLGRVDSGKISSSGSGRILPLNIVENTNTIAVIVVISMISVTAIGGYFFLRKRREQN